jgi:hypothetical protein
MMDATPQNVRNAGIGDDLLLMVLREGADESSNVRQYNLPELVLYVRMTR